MKRSSQRYRNVLEGVDLGHAQAEDEQRIDQHSCLSSTDMFVFFPFCILALATAAPLNVFVVTVGRSGATILMNVLQSIDGFCIRGENKGVIHGLAEASFRAQLAKSMDENVNASAFAAALAVSFRDHVLRCPLESVAVGFKEIRYESLGPLALNRLLKFLLAHSQTRGSFSTFVTWRALRAAAVASVGA